MNTLEIYNDTEIDLENIKKDVSIQIEKFKKLPLIKKVFTLLEDLPKDIKYHNKKHAEDVLHEAVLFATIDNLNEAEKENIAVAATMHDMGFLFKREHNEKEAVRFIDEGLSKEEFGDLDIESIKKMILDTEVKMTEKGPSIIMSYSGSAYLLDADVSDFGRTDFKEKSRLIKEELHIDLNDYISELNFLESTLSLMQNQVWHTLAANKLRQKQKLINIKELKEEIVNLKIKVQG